MTSPRNIIYALNTDALLQIFEYLWPDGGLRPLSMTCWSMREATMSMLFSHCKVLVKAPVNTDRFIPRSLWPYIRKLTLIDKCPDLVAMSDSPRELKFTSDPLLCGTMSATFLKDTLRAMPHLRSVCLKLSAREVHGIGWDSIAAILSTPQLRSFTIGSFLLSPREAPSEKWADILAPITTFRYEQPSDRSYLRTYPVQQDSLAFVLTHLRRSLESLLLPSEITSIAVLSHAQWSQLRELSLNGEFHPGAGRVAPFVSLFSRMLRLRVLNLTLALPKDIDRRQLIFWPEGYESRLPWPDLEALTISFPDPEDRIFAHLPPSLRRLSLRCTPHHCLHLWGRNQHFFRHSPMLHASEMLEILTKVSAPLLDSLQLEYHADDADDDLLLCIAKTFPNVRSLEVHRFLASCDDDVPVANIGRRLANLRSLHTLRAHLQLPESIAVQSPRGTVQEFPAVVKCYFEGNIEELCQTAAALGNTLSQSGLQLWLLQREDCGARWRLFRRVIKQIDHRDSRAELDPAGGRGISLYAFK
ncbi:hypothetical protein LXA43DRAFT_944518 [Ganoderma leucocontextum]|nr:hypothetical protein LXA43DRAFT_944518 [Ganoderma leucocontextum]